jgi:hypothetical protein
MDQMSQAWFLAWQDFSLFHGIQSSSEANPTSCPVDIGGHFFESKEAVT